MSGTERTLPADEQFKEPKDDLHGPDDLWAYVSTKKGSLTLEQGEDMVVFTIAGARKFRDWLNEVLP